MIGFLEGEIKAIGEDFLLVKTSGGVGYVVFCPAGILAKQSLGNSTSLFIETIVKEDSITLFGFETYKELIWFRSLLKVSGVGAKIALLILSSFKINDIIFAIENGQKDFFTSISGVGDKLAVRLAGEMKKEPKKNASVLTSTLISNYTHEEEKAPESASFNLVRDASLALESLGFAKQNAYSVCLSAFNENPQISLSDLIKLGLKNLKENN
jgi:Holliday junction DNA helicase RuvA